MADPEGEESAEARGKMSGVLDTLEGAGHDGTVSIGDVVESMRDQSFAPMLLVPALLLASPLSGIPGTPTVSALIIGLIVVQMLIGRDHLWLPAFLSRRQVSKQRMSKAIGFLRRPVAFSDRLLRARISFLAERPWNYAALLACLAITLAMPLMEFLPFLASIAALAIALFAAGILIRDGVLIIAGYIVVGVTVMAGIGLT